MPITHLKVSAVADGSDPSEIQPSDWNAEHVISITPAEIGAIGGSGVVGRVAEFVTDAGTIQAANLIAPTANILTLTNAAASTLALNITAAKTLTLTAADNYTLTIPATGTAALLGTANVFTTQQMVDGTSDQIQLRVQGHSTQTADYMTFENSAGTVVTKFDPAGRLNFIANTAAPGNGNFIYYKGSGISGLRLRSDSYIILEPGNTADLYQFTSSGIEINSPAVANAALINVRGISNNTGYASIKADTYRTSTTATNYAIWGTHTGVGGTGAIAGYFTATSTATSVWGVYIGKISTGTNNYAIQTNGGLVSFIEETTTTNAVKETLRLTTQVSTASTGSANGFGTGLSWYAETATDGTNQQQGLISASWVDATNATRKAKLSLSAYDTAARLGLEIEATGTDVTLLALGKLAFTQADLNEYIDSLADGYIDYRATNGHRFGDGTNSFDISASGDLTLTGTAKYERHFILRPALNGSPVNQPTEIDVFTASALEFASIGTKYAYCQWEIPDDWDGTDIYFEVDWNPNSGAMSGTDAVKWDVEYRSLAEGEAMNNGTSVTLTATDTSDYAQYVSKHTRFTLAYNNANQPLTAQDHIFFKISRDTSVANDFAGTVAIIAFEVVYNSKGLPTN